MSMSYSSEIVCQAAGIEPSGHPSKRSGFCSYCARPIAEGDVALEQPLAGQRSFTNGADLAASGNKLACGWCAAIIPKYITPLAGTIACKDGVFSVLKDTARAWLFLTPPEPPYVVTIASQQRQHLTWRTPPTLTNDLQIIRYGNELLQIRREFLLKAVDACKVAGKLYGEEKAKAAEEKRGGKKVKAKIYSHPFVSLDREMTDLRHGQFFADVWVYAAKNEELKQSLLLLQQCTPGELWALATLAKKETPEPVKPESVLHKLKN